MNTVKEQALSKLQKVDQKRQEKYDRKTDKLSDKIFDNTKSTSDKRIVPFTTIGFDSIEDALVIGIEPQFATSENMEEYAKSLELL